MPRELPQDSKPAHLPNAIHQERGGNWTSVHEAAAMGNENLLQSLLSGQADSRVKEFKYGNTPLHESASRGYSRCVKILCAPITSEAAANNRHHKEAKSRETTCSVHASILSIQNYAGFTALHLAAQNGHNQSCRELLLAGADPDVENYYGDTALHTACRYGHAGATRILLSAFCNVNKGNLNGDTPLHITCAMGRHKLTRILLEAECEINTRNAQEETPRGIALRKGYGKILEILSNPHRIRNKRGNRKDEEASAPISNLIDSKDVSGIKKISWSPYGCHYFPDPNVFPSPKLETLPKEPLRNGEQYYLDLAGHIRKGPIGIGNICYCGPFFKHIEDKINLSKIQLQKYVNNAKEDLGDKVQALAVRTNQQIEKLTRSMIADRVHCENRRKYLQNCLSLSDPHRPTAENILKSKQSEKVENNTLKRCKSWGAIVKDDTMQNELFNCRSYDVLWDKLCAKNCKDPKTETYTSELAKTDFCNVTARLGSLLAKTDILLKESKGNDTYEVRFPNIKHTNQKNIDARNHSDINNVVQGMAEAELDFYSIVQKTNPVFATTDVSPSKTIVDKHSSSSMQMCQNHCAILCSFQHRNSFEYFCDTKRNGRMLQNVISALHTDDHENNFEADIKTLKESENNHDYKDEETLVNRIGLFTTTLLRNGAREDTNHETHAHVHKSSTASEEYLMSIRNQTTKKKMIKTKLLNWAQNVNKKKCTGEQQNEGSSENSYSEKSVSAKSKPPFQNRIPSEIENSNEVNEHFQQSRLTQSRHVSNYNILYNKSPSSELNDAYSNTIFNQKYHSKHFLVKPMLNRTIDRIEPSNYPLLDKKLKFQRFIPNDAYFHELPNIKNCKSVSVNRRKETAAPKNSGINWRCFNTTMVPNTCRAYDFKLKSLCKNQTSSNYVLSVQAYNQRSFENPVNSKTIPAVSQCPGPQYI